MEESLRYFGNKVDGLIRGQSLTRDEARDLFKQILTGVYKISKK